MGFRLKTVGLSVPNSKEIHWLQWIRSFHYIAGGPYLDKGTYHDRALKELRTENWNGPTSALDLELLQNRATKGKSRHRNLNHRFRLRDMLGIG